MWKDALTVMHVFTGPEVDALRSSITYEQALAQEEMMRGVYPEHILKEMAACRPAQLKLCTSPAAVGLAAFVWVVQREQVPACHRQGGVLACHRQGGVLACHRRSKCCRHLNDGTCPAGFVRCL